jgi:hypothetical protein
MDILRHLRREDEPTPPPAKSAGEYKAHFAEIW